ncbi:MAG: hypothetical protein HKN23_00905 [Verrucomicrobiales bacterium]|nr:hypothetical protein [Verrucomicrobiales bacterium]
MSRGRKQWMRSAAVCVALTGLILTATEGQAQFEPAVKTDWRFHVGDNWMGMVEYQPASLRGETFLFWEGGRKLALPFRIEIAALVVLAVPIAAILCLATGIRGLIQFQASRKRTV